MLWKQSTIGFSFSVRLYYVVIAIGDFFICIRHLLWNVLCVTLALYSSDRLYFCFDTLSDGSCIVVQYLYCYSEILANYSLVGLTFERFIAVCLPLRAHTLLSSRWTLAILTFLCVPFALYFTVLIPFSVAIVPFVRVTGHLCDSNSALAGTIFSFSSVFVLSSLHAFIVLVLSVFIFTRLRQQSRDRRSLTSYSTASVGKPALRTQTRSIAVTLTTISLATVTVINYGAYSISIIVNTISKHLPGTTWQFHLTSLQISLFLVLCSIIPHCVNIFVYMVFIPSFRRAILCLRSNSSAKSLTI